LPNQQIVIKRKDARGTIEVQYGVDPWFMNVRVTFMGARGGMIDQQHISHTRVREFGNLLLAVSKIKPEDRNNLTKFYHYMYFNMSKKLNIWMENSEELAAVLLMIADKYKLKGV
jgi:hypothetical protein